ncbi:hypothetical protein ACRB68_70020 [Actinomadura sp. RB68]|uniref:Uncharacterized protein n=1 Tax=Actinomadura macrotermitis TaxID=2585200 RepID=A0A7K0C603_9ACTN|nr:hypothetical protein [Actinomadura macrotermitis]
MGGGVVGRAVVGRVQCVQVDDQFFDGDEVAVCGGGPETVRGSCS